MPRQKLNAAGMKALAAIAGLTIIAAPIAAAHASPSVPLSVLDALVAKEAIRAKIAQYSLLFDGDGIGRHPDKWAEALWTEDATFQAFGADGQSIIGKADPGFIGRNEILRVFGAPIPPDAKFAARHAFASTTFDEVTADTARTRTIGFVIRGSKAEPAMPGGAQPPLSTYVYHDTWRKGADGEWRKSKSIVYCSVWCQAALKAPSE